MTVPPLPLAGAGALATDRHPGSRLNQPLLPAFFSNVHPRFRTPFASQALIGVVRPVTRTMRCSAEG
jgi:hypothetical protein